MEKKAFWLICIVLIVFYLFSGLVFASPFIIGYVNDSYSGTVADGNVVLLWKYSVGTSDNLTDIIGPNGNSGANNFFMIDCAMLANPCSIGDILSLRVLNLSGRTVTQTVNVTVTGAGFDLTPNMMINSAPNVSLISPVNQANISNEMVFNCSAVDLDGNLANITLYSNFTGVWEANETKPVTGYYNSTIFTKNNSDGRYLWSCLVRDDLGLINSTSNRTLTFDNLVPNINSVYVNETKVCGLSNTLRVSCNTSDGLSGIQSVIIQAKYNLSSNNYTALFLGDNVYYSDILVNQTGIWNFTCFSNDSAGNINSFLYSFNQIFENFANLFVNSFDIFFSKNDPLEGEEISINVSVGNDGCSDANGTLIGFYEGDPFLGGIQISNETENISKGLRVNLSINWQSKIGKTDIFVLVDANDSFMEDNESDNKANRSISVVSWHLFYGNITADRILASYNSANMSLWLNETNSSGNVYVSDVESNINWARLIALGRNISGGIVNNDFNDLDSILGSSNYTDSISNVYTSDGSSPINTTDFLVSNKNISNVPIINTTSNYNFFTGILWDSSDDSDGQYGGLEEEDVIFLAQIKRKSLGSFGNYDYELRVPSKLREYNDLDSSEVYIYFDLN